MVFGTSASGIGDRVKDFYDRNGGFVGWEEAISEAVEVEGIAEERLLEFVEVLDT